MVSRSCCENVLAPSACGACAACLASPWGVICARVGPAEMSAARARCMSCFGIGSSFLCAIRLETLFERLEKLAPGERLDEERNGAAALHGLVHRRLVVRG